MQSTGPVDRPWPSVILRGGREGGIVGGPCQLPQESRNIQPEIQARDLKIDRHKAKTVHLLQKHIQTRCCRFLRLDGSSWEGLGAGRTAIR